MRRAGVLVAVVALAAASAGCGARWSDDQKAIALASLEGRAVSDSASLTGSEATSGSAGGAGPSTTVALSGGGVSSGSGSAGTGGDGGGGGTGDAAPASLPCAAPSDAPGVTDSEIVVGTINSLSGPVPGLGASHLAATQAYIAYRNSLGGVCGRQIVLRSGDDGGDNARYRSIVADLHPHAFAFVAGVAGGADGGVDLIDAERLPFVGMSITPGIEKSPTYYGVNPPLASYDVEIGKYAYLRDHGVHKAAVVYIAAASSPQEAKRQMALMRAAGMEIVLEQALPLTTLSYDSTARAVANSGADYLLFLHADGPSASMAKAMDDTGYELKFEEYIVAYGSKFIELAGSASEGATSWLYALPAEDGGAVAEQAAFLQWMAQIAPDASVDTFASRGWAGVKLLFDSMEAVPGPLSRDALVDVLAHTGSYDAGGMIDPVHIGDRISNGCVIGMIVKGGTWHRLVPKDGFLC